MSPAVRGVRITHREQTTANIYAALSDLLAERGYDAISLADIAERAGMARTAMYNYFSDKESLLLGYAQTETDRFVATLDDALREVDNPVEQLRAYLRLQLEYFSDNHLPLGPALRVLLPEAAASEVMEHVGVLEDRLRRIVETGQARRYLVAEDVDATVAMISACISRGSANGPEGLPLAATIAATESFVLRAVGVRLGPDDKPRKLPRR